jgi:hypothetical protein
MLLMLSASAHIVMLKPVASGVMMKVGQGDDQPRVRVPLEKAPRMTQVRWDLFSEDGPRIISRSLPFAAAQCRQTTGGSTEKTRAKAGHVQQGDTEAEPLNRTSVAIEMAVPW